MPLGQALCLSWCSRSLRLQVPPGPTAALSLQQVLSNLADPSAERLKAQELSAKTGSCVLQLPGPIYLSTLVSLKNSSVMKLQHIY